MDEQTEVKYGIDKKRLRLIIIVAAAVLFFVGQSVYLRTRDNTQPTQNVNDVSYQNAYEYLLGGISHQRRARSRKPQRIRQKS